MDGKRCWLPDETDGYTLGRVLRVKSGIATCQALRDDENVGTFCLHLCASYLLYY